MIGNTKLNLLTDVFRSKGFNPIIGNIYDMQSIWESWYRGSVNNFHYYDARNIDGNIITLKRKSLNMAKKVCEDWAGLLFNENTKLVVNDEKAQAIIDKVLDHNNFIDEASDFIEKTMMSGTGVIIPFIEKGSVELDFLTENIIPLTSRNNRIEELATVSTFKHQKQHLTHVTYHTFRDNKYRIYHELYASRQESYLGNKISFIGILFDESELKTMKKDDMGLYFEYEVPFPFFFVFRPAIANNFDVNSPMGISVFANSIGLLESIDQEFDAMSNETDLSKKRLFINSEATKTAKIKEETANDVHIRYVKYFDNNDTLFQSIKMPDDLPMKEFSPEYRIEQYINGLKFKFNLLSAETGLGNQYYQFDMTGGVTATQIISVKSDTWKNREKHIKRLREVLIKLMYSVLYLEKSINGYVGDVESLEYDVYFDDSIIVDDEARGDRLISLANQGYIEKWRVVEHFLNVSEEEAKEIVKSAKKEDDLMAFMGIENADRED